MHATESPDDIIARRNRLQSLGIPSPHYRVLRQPDEVAGALDGFERVPRIRIVGGVRDGEWREPAKVATCLADAEALLADDRCRLVLEERLSGPHYTLEFPGGTATPAAGTLRDAEDLARVVDELLAPLRDDLGAATPLVLEVRMTATGPRLEDYRTG